MQNLDAAFLLSSPDIVEPVAPWCTRLGNIELGILLLAHPLIVMNGLRRAELERRLGGLARQLPVGPVYFQRVRRAAADLEARGALHGGAGREKRFVTTPEGFAALILNLRSLCADPTLEGSEFEFKLGLVVMWNLVAQQLFDLRVEPRLSPDIERFFDAVLGVEVLGCKVVSERSLRETFDVQSLIDLQRERVKALQRTVSGRLECVQGSDSSLEATDHVQVPREIATLLAGNPWAMTVVGTLASRTLPAVRAEAELTRYEAYLAYLEAIRGVYAARLRVVDITGLRAAAGGDHRG